MNPLRRRAAALLAVLALAVAACGGGTPSPVPTAASTPSATPAPTATPTDPPAATPTAAPTASAPSAGGRTGRIEVPDSGFAVTLADGWMEIPLDPDDIDAIVAAIPDEAIAEQLRGQLPVLLMTGVKLWAFDVSATTSGGNLIVITQPGEVPASLLVSIAEQSAGMIQGIQGEVSVAPVTVDGVEGAVVSFTVAQQGATLDQTQLYTSTNGVTYIFTFTDPAGSSGDAVDAMLRSIEFLP